MGPLAMSIRVFAVDLPRKMIGPVLFLKSGPMATIGDWQVFSIGLVRPRPPQPKFGLAP